MAVTIYSKVGCSYCDQAENLCKESGLDYEKLLLPIKEVSYIVGQTVRIFPQISVNGKYLGDFNDFHDYVQTLEPLLDENKRRYAMFPIQYPKLWELYKKSQMSNWTAEEIDLAKDIDDWEKMSKDEQHFVKYVLAFFAGSDTIVYDNINANFMDEIVPMEAKAFYAYQSHNEMVHGETYSKLIDKYIKDSREKKNLFNAIENIPSIKLKAKWAEKYFDKKITFGERLFAFACVEGIFF